jgi:hypothetical protein
MFAQSVGRTCCIFAALRWVEPRKDCTASDVPVSQFPNLCSLSSSSRRATGGVRVQRTSADLVASARSELATNQCLNSMEVSPVPSVAVAVHNNMIAERTDDCALIRETHRALNICTHNTWTVNEILPDASVFSEAQDRQQSHGTKIWESTESLPFCRSVLHRI